MSLEELTQQVREDEDRILKLEIVLPELGKKQDQILEILERMSKGDMTICSLHQKDQEALEKRVKSLEDTNAKMWAYIIGFGISLSVVVIGAGANWVLSRLHF